MEFRKIKTFISLSFYGLIVVYVYVYVYRGMHEYAIISTFAVLVKEFLKMLIMEESIQTKTCSSIK